MGPKKKATASRNLGREKKSVFNLTPARKKKRSAVGKGTITSGWEVQSVEKERDNLV